MRDFTIALIQHNSPVGQKAKNLEQTVAWTKKAKKKGAELVCFPELNITGHAGHPEMVKEAEPVPGGESVHALVGLARELGVYLCAGIAEDDRGLHYNTQFLVGPHGYIGKQRKVHLSNDEYFYFRGGTDLPVFELPMARVGIIICYDNLIPEVSRCLAVKGAEVLLCPHAARSGKWRKDTDRKKVVESVKKNWRMVHSCRAYDNGVFVAICNAAGRAAMRIKGVEANHAGGCMVVDPTGAVIAESKSKNVRDEMLVVPLKGDAAAARRRQSCFNLQTRRPEAFEILSKPTN
ncbi:MAG: nitrilase-related carbon-nitrogen hydrolase [Planctomycetota bacterium]